MKFPFAILLIFTACSGYSPQETKCEDVFTPYTPVSELTKETFHGYSGGKYPGNSNAIPFAHFSRGMELANRITPLDREGNADSVGKVGFVILGFSTAAMTGNVFKWIYSMKQADSQFTIAIGAQGGMDINAMIDPGSGYWEKADSDIRAEGLTNAQIQLAWVSTGDMLFSEPEFPAYSLTLADKYRDLLYTMQRHYPNLKIAFLSDRTFAGYIDDKGPQKLAEPTAYFTGWAVKFFISRQLQQEAGYSYLEMPFVDWGPQLWTNGAAGNSKNYRWDCDDAAKGGIHPTAKGRSKEALVLYHFFSHHPYTSRWFTSRQTQEH